MKHSAGKHVRKSAPPMRQIRQDGNKGPDADSKGQDQDMAEEAEDTGMHNAQVAGYRGKPSMAELMYPSMMKKKGKMPNAKDGM